MATAEQVRAAVDGYAQSFVTADRDRFLSDLAPDVIQEEPAGSTPNKGVAALARSGTRSGRVSRRSSSSPVSVRRG